MSPHAGSRPASIMELAQIAQQDSYDPTKTLKTYLRLAEKNRTDARQAEDQGDLETAFVKYARAATLVLEKLPTHRDFKMLLTEEQRNNLDLNGRDILDRLSEIKPILLERYESWAARNPNNTPASRQLQTPASEPRHAQWRPSDVPQHTTRDDQDRQLRDAERHRYEQQRREEDDQRRREHSRREQQTGREDKYASWEQRRHESRRRDDERVRNHREEQAVEANSRREYTSTFNTTEMLRQQEEARKRQEAERKEQEHRHRQEQEGILARQRESEQAARTAREENNRQGSGLPYQAMPAPPSGYAANSRNNTPAFPPIGYPSLSGIQAPKALGSESRPPSFLGLMMPLEGPSRPDDSETDSETVGSGRNNLQRQASSNHPRPPSRSPSYPPPITTTSPPPPDGPVLYPRLMTQHQKRQGYVPSMHSMFMTSGSAPASTSFLLEKGQQSLYPPDILPRSSSQHAYNAPPHRSQSSYSTEHHQHAPQHSQHLQYPTLPTNTSTASNHPPSNDSRNDARSNSGPVSTADLKTVILPRDSLPRFLSIARLNTSLNRETCGLLLGKDKGHRYVVTTLLIPKQHSTSDTCTMDEEELVLQFTEGRSLITLGWIHTHPSQSCFMSSVDLHTHSGFQRMLPESFAVVCAPKHNPNFGIFRLTDPPGLQTVLDCQAKEAFHPHPDVPIYTDADKGHVQMKDMALEIVDLR